MIITIHYTPQSGVIRKWLVFALQYHLFFAIITRVLILKGNRLMYTQYQPKESHVQLIMLVSLGSVPKVRKTLFESKWDPNVRSDDGVTPLQRLRLLSATI